MDIDSLTLQAKTGFSETFGHQATVISAAPGRVNLIGEHIDYCDGFVMPFALEQNIIIAASPNGKSIARLASSKSGTGEIAEIELSREIVESEPKWANYPRGVMHLFRQQMNCELPGFDAYIVSNVPSGGGLSSSAAFELSMATLLEGLTDQHMETRDKALLCQKAEHTFAHVPCGIMDQFASAFGQKNRLVMIDCQTGEPTLVPFDNPELTVIVANTCVSHELSDGGYAARRKNTEDGLTLLGKASWRDVSISDVDAAAQKMGETIHKRSRHVVGEIQRTMDAAKALEAGEFETLGSLMYASHVSLRDDFEVSCAELDIMVEIARTIGQDGGVIGARMTGGGFGGSTVTLCRTAEAGAITAKMQEEYQQRTGITAEIFTSRPSAGARLL